MRENEGRMNVKDRKWLENELENANKHAINGCFKNEGKSGISHRVNNKEVSRKRSIIGKFFSFCVILDNFPPKCVL